MKIDNVEVVDAQKKVKLVITKRDVELGNTKNPLSCAAARAAVRQLHCEAARVHLGRVYLKIKGKWTRFVAPASLRTELVAFDRGGTFMPGEHVLLPPKKSQRLGSRYGSKNDKRKGKSKRMAPYHATNVRVHGLVGGSEK